jgi:hypothetical protein
MSAELLLIFALLAGALLLPLRLWLRRRLVTETLGTMSTQWIAEYRSSHIS